jgi:hypothetical protein
MKHFYDLLFDEGELICWSSDVYGTKLYPKSDPQRANYFSINPLHTSRKDANVTAFRNILIEFDKLALPEQLAAFAEIPISTLVFSGGKSYHGIISLQTPCSTREEYNELVWRVYERVSKFQPDKGCKNPSRFSRSPGVLRDNIEQRLERVGERIPNAALEEWLPPKKPKRETFSVPIPHRMPVSYHLLSLRRPEPGTRNNALFACACDFFRASYTLEEVLQYLNRLQVLPEREVRAIAASAQKAVRK